MLRATNIFNTSTHIQHVGKQAPLVFQTFDMTYFIMCLSGPMILDVGVLLETALSNIQKFGDSHCASINYIRNRCPKSIEGFFNGFKGVKLYPYRSI